MTQNIIYIIPLFGVLALLYTFWKSSWVSKQDVGTDKMAGIAKNIADGAMAFLRAEYRVLAIFVVVVAGLMAWSGMNEGSSPLVAVSFILGAICSALAGFIGMRVATKANVRTLCPRIRTYWRPLPGHRMAINAKANDGDNSGAVTKSPSGPSTLSLAA